MVRTVFLICFMLIANYVLLGQENKTKFGKIDKEELEMKYYEKDSSAPAVILYDCGHFYADRFKYFRHLRIKVLNKNGLEYGNHVFNISAASDVKGFTYNLENGEIIKEKLKSESVYREEYFDDYDWVKVSMPNVKVGSVIDIEYSYDGFPIEWNFQNIIPTVWSELYLEPSAHVQFQKTFTGFEPLAVIEANRWVAIDMPAFKKEPYMNSMENYRTKLVIDIKEISFPGYYKAYAKSWEDVDKTLLDHTRFGVVLRASGHFNQVATEIKEKQTEPIERMKEAYNYIKQNIKYNHDERILSSNTSTKYILKDQIGNSADINISLVQLLTKLDIEAYPIAMSTRRSGLLSVISPSLYKLNYVIAIAIIDGKEYLLDATDQACPYNMLPKRSLNIQGRLVDKEKGRWVTLTPSKKYDKTVFYTLTLSEEGTLKGKMDISLKEYAAYEFGYDFANYGSKEEYINEFTRKNPGLKVENFEFKGLYDLNAQIRISLDVDINNFMSIVEKEIYLTPLLFEQVIENEFVSAEREYPIDFAFARKNSVIVNIRLPEGYSVSELPKPLIMKMPENAANVTYSLTSNANMLQIMYKCDVNKTIITSQEYPLIRQFFDQIVKKHKEPIVLVKK